MNSIRLFAAAFCLGLIALASMAQVGVTRASAINGAGQFNTNLTDLGSHTLTLGAALIDGTGVGPAGSGFLRLRNGQTIVGRNAANSGDVEIARVDGSNRVLLGQGGSPVGYDGTINRYGGLTCAGECFPAIYAVGRNTGKTAADTNFCTYTPTADGSFEVSFNVLATTATSYSFNSQVAYTDEGNSARTINLPMERAGDGAITSAAMTNSVAGPYQGIPIHIRAKANTAINVSTVGTFTTVTYNDECVIRQLQ